MKTLLAIWNYLKDSWEDEKGHLSYKRISQFIWSWLVVIQVLRGTVTGQWNFYVFLTTAVLFALTGALITVPQLIEMIKGYGETQRNRDMNYFGGGSTYIDADKINGDQDVHNSIKDEPKEDDNKQS